VPRGRVGCTTTRSNFASSEPELALGSRSPRQEVVRVKAKRRPEALELVGLRQGEPLHMQHVGSTSARGRQRAWVLDPPSAAAAGVSGGTAADDSG
jgi:hypothetical protein